MNNAVVISVIFCDFWEGQLMHNEADGWGLPCSSARHSACWRSLFSHFMSPSRADYFFFFFVVSSTAYTAEACENKSNRYHLYLNKKNIKNIKIWLLIGSMNAMCDCRFPTLKEQLRKYNQRSAISLQLSWHFNHCGLYIKFFYVVDISKCK